MRSFALPLCAWPLLVLAQAQEKASERPPEEPKADDKTLIHRFP